MPFLNRTIPLWTLLPIMVLAFVLGFAMDRFVTPAEQPDPVRKTGELRQLSGMLTSPLLECEVFEDQSLKVLQPFKYKVEKLLQEKLDAGIITEGSVYFRDLNNGLWFGINEQLRYHPASLLKVPIMMACFKRADKDPRFLTKKILYRGDFDLERWQGIRPSTPLEQGQSYTVEELVRHMISLSDNNAAQLLVDTIGLEEMNRVMQEIDVNVDPENPEYFITMHGYAGFFRVLYNASYLNRELSEKALEILARSEFMGGLRGGLPPGQLAATKFGEAGAGANPEIVQMHEVGIVYYPGRPYLLGIMTRGRRGNDFETVLRDISRLVYTAVAGQGVPAGAPSAKMFK